MKRVRPDSSSYRKPVSNECMHILTKISMVDFFFFFSLKDLSVLIKKLK